MPHSTLVIAFSQVFKLPSLFGRMSSLTQQTEIDPGFNSYSKDREIRILMHTIEQEPNEKS